MCIYPFVFQTKHLGSRPLQGYCNSCLTPVEERQSLQENLKSTYPPPKWQLLLLRVHLVSTCIFSSQRT